MPPTSAIIMLAGIYYGSQYGGTITSVLINTPGESASVVTCIDGYQMALQGRAGAALGVAALGSFIAGTFGVVLLMVMSPLLARWALSFGPPETFALMLLGLTTVTGLTGENALKGYISMVLGLMLAMVGFDIIGGEPRYTGGINEMLDGVDFLPVAIGLFGMGEVLLGAEQRREHGHPQGPLRHPRRVAEPGRLDPEPLGDRPGHPARLLHRRPAGRRLDDRLVPRLHAGEEGLEAPRGVRQGRHRGRRRPRVGEQRRLGRRHGAAADARHPGLGHHRRPARRLHDVGAAPGPLLFEKNPDFVWGLIASMYIGNVMLVILNIAFIPFFVWALRIPYTVLMPLIIVFCVTGAYAANNRVWDVGLMLIFGVLGYVMRKLDYSPAALTLALVLGPLAERALRQSLIISDSGMAIFFQRPIAAVLTTAAILWVGVPVTRAVRDALARGRRSAWA